jgi:rod shape-determining protein MreD
MSALVLVFSLLVGAVLQSVLPSLGWLGHAPFPILLGLVIYYALLGTSRQTLTAAILAGLVSDALALVPLGYTSFSYLLAGLAVRHFREVVMARQWSTHALFGGVAHAATTLLCFVLLLQSDRPALSLGTGLGRVAGALVTGCLAVPIVCTLLLSLEQTLGHRPLEEST